MAFPKSAAPNWKPRMPETKSYWSPERKYGLRLPVPLESVLITRSIKSIPQETGGVLVGYYTENLRCAVATDASGPPPDSQAGRTWFHRGTRGLDSWLDRLWSEKGHYFIGEWHCHMGTVSSPSPTDYFQLREIAFSTEYQCAIPLLLIVCDLHTRPRVRAYVFAEGGRLVELTLEDSFCGCSY